MRLLYVSHSFPASDRPLSNVGGMQRVAVDLHRAFAAESEVDLHSLLLQASWRWTGVRTPPFLLSLLHRIPGIVEQRRIEVVLFSSMVTAAVVPVLRERIRAAGAIAATIPVGRDVTLPNPAYQRFVPRVLRSMDLILPISRATAAACLERGAPAGNVHVVPCGTECGEPVGSAERAASRSALIDLLSAREMRAAGEPLLLLSVGRHQERKGFHWFIDQVMPRLGENTIYLLVGSGPMTRTIEESVERRGLGGRVALLGQVDEEMLKTLYAGTDLFVMPNIPVAGDIEGFGVVMVEAGAAGLPVIAADLEGIRDVVTPGENGTLVTSSDPAAFARAIDGYRDRQTRELASARAADHVRAHFAWSAIARAHLDIFSARLTSSAKEPGDPAQDRHEASEDLRQHPQQDRLEEKA
ncbi:MAG: glycosyltransferase family 4 protein [Gemmatimonadota bacterium]